MTEGQVGVRHIVDGNTLLVTNKLGPSYIFLGPSGRWRAGALHMEQVVEGTWRLDGERLCLRQTAPLPEGLGIGPENCIAVRSTRFDEAWSVPDPRGGKLTYKWLPGDAAKQHAR